MIADPELKRSVQAELDWDPRFDARDIAITVKSGVVTLSGTVDSFAERIAAEACTESVRGVRAIANEIRVQLPEAMRTDDTSLAAAALKALSSNALVPSERIKVIVREGWVTLDGEVSFRHQREAAEQAVQNLYGMKGLINEIVVTAHLHVEASVVKANIEDAFRRRARIDADGIRVRVDDGELLLTGQVGSLRERREAEAAAWATHGVRKVQNQIQVGP